jgi:hypothetical protein
VQVTEVFTVKSSENKVTILLIVGNKSKGSKVG